MAVDEAILTSVGRGDAPPTLRFYTWSTPWVSLGSSQSHLDLDRTAIEREGLAIVRRSSGGTAVLHRGQLGYAAVLPADHSLWTGDLARSYERLSAPLLHAFTRLGAAVAAAPPGANADFIRNAPLLASRSCFGGLGPYEIVTAQSRKKLVGNSQVRRKLSSTQHGVIQVHGNQDSLALMIVGTRSERADLANYLGDHVESLEAVLGRPVHVAEVVDAIVDGFRQTLGIQFELGDLSPDERASADELIAAKYGNPAWTFRR